MRDTIRNCLAAPAARRRGAVAIAALVLCALPLLSALPLAETDAVTRPPRLWQPPDEPWVATGMPVTVEARFVPALPATAVQPGAVLLLRPRR